MRTATLLRRRLLQVGVRLCLPLFLVACGDGGVLTAGDRPDRSLASGLYEYNAWSHLGGLDWWGTLDLEVERDGRITGFYRLPRQCTDAYGYEADCVGHVGGRVYDDGEVRFGLDEGWLSHYGEVRSRYRAVGDWDSRILGYSGYGEWEIVAY